MTSGVSLVFLLMAIAEIFARVVLQQQSGEEFGFGKLVNHFPENHYHVFLEIGGRGEERDS